MDYDDHDFQCQSFQIVGEDINKLPPSFQLLPLPRFDFDEQLQIHPRFDSLVETEVLLGIHDNSWMEDFTPVRSEIEFSTTAADTCSIPSPKNVWSEATSSESVEMLLESVGVEEMTNQKVTIKEADAGVAVIGMDRQTESPRANEFNSETASYQLKVEGSFVPSEHKNSGKCDYVSSPTEKFNSDEKFIDRQCSLETTLTPSPPVHAIVNTSVHGQAFCGAVQIDDPLHNTCIKSTTDGSITCGVSFENSDLTLRSTEDSLPKQVMGESNEIEVCERPDSFEDSVQKKGSQIEGNNVRDQPSQGPGVRSDLSSAQDSEPLDYRCSDLEFPVKPSCFHESQSEGPLLFEEVVEHQELTTTQLPAPVLIQCKENEAENFGSTIMKNDITNAQLSKEYDHPVTVDRLSTKAMAQDEPAVNVDMPSFGRSADAYEFQPKDRLDKDVVVEQKEETAAELPALLLIQPDEKQVETSGTTIIKSKKGAGVSRERDYSIISDRSPSDHMTQDEQAVAPIDSNLHSLDNPTVTHKSQSEGILSMDMDVDQKDVEISDSTKLVSKSDAQFSIESDDAVAVNKSSVKELNKDESALVDSSLHSQNKSSDVHQAQPEDTISLDWKQKGATTEVLACRNEKLENPGNAVLESTIGVPVLLDSDQLVAVNSSPAKDMTQIEPVSQPTALGLASSSVEVSAVECQTEMQDSIGTHENALQSGRIGSPTVIGHSAQDDTDPSVSISNDPSSVSSEARVKDDKVKSCSHDPKESKTSEDTRSFTFEVGSLTESERDQGNKWKPFSDIPSSELTQCNLRTSKENNQETILESEIQCDRTITENPEKDNTTNVSAFSTADSTIISPAKVVKETSSKKKSAGSDGNPCSTSKSVRKKSAESGNPHTPPKSIGTVNRNAKLEETQQHYPCTDSNIKESRTPVVDPNISISALALFHQPFTDLQQVQLRAQIFVYGSLMQGNPPDEACMISAFGGADGGRCLWEGLWRLSAERYHIQKSPFNSYQTPPHSDSVIRASEQGPRCSTLESKPPCIAIQIGGNVAASATTSMSSLTPPHMWSASLGESHSSKPRNTHLEFNQASTSSYSHQPSQIKQYTVNSAQWLTHFPHPEPWVDSSQNTAVDAIAQYSTVSLTEAIQATPARVSSTPHVPSMQLVTPSSFFGSPETKSVSATPLVQIDSQRKKMTPRRNKSTLPIEISRSRQKDPLVHELLQPTILVEQLPDPASVAATSHIIAPIDYRISRTDTGQRAIFSEETRTKLEYAKLQAEDAAAFAASAVRHSQDVWNELATRKNSGLVSGVDGELASAAVAVAAAANVAKAAAAAAKVASDAALQAKLMADEAMDSVRTGNLTQISESDPLDVGKSLVKLTPYSILKGKDETKGSSSIISTARETARRRVETASAATKRAENLVAIMRAAELAAEAVSQAGIIIAMGEPLPYTLSGLVEAGLEGHWKGHHSSSSKPDKTSSTHGEENLGLDSAKKRGIPFEELHEQPSNIRRAKRTYKKHVMISSIENPVQPEEHCEVLPDLQNEQSHAILDEGHQNDHSASNAKQSGIQKGCLVEVKAEGRNQAWFSARVLDVKDGNCYICYENLVSDEGSGLLKEWVSLEDGADKAPRIRLAHPVTTTKYEGLRKRRREDKWAVGDHVDAWIHDGWREGIVTERCHGDDTKLMVRFIDGDDSSTIRASDLRVTLVWKDGSWIEWCNVRENAVKCEGDTPQEKRQKLSRMEADIDSDHNGEGANKVLQNSSVVDSRKPEELRPLNLSAKERLFSVGNNAREENTCDTLKFRQAGHQKEGSRVVFGVPKPGKKRKFMDVSKHYIDDKKEKTSEVIGSVKHGKYTVPPTSRVLRNTSKVDSKGKGAIDSKPVGFKSSRSRSIQMKSTTDKNNSSFISTNGGDSADTVASKGRAASSNEQKNLEKKSRLELGSHTNLDAAENQNVERQMFVPVFPSSRRKPASTVEADPRARRKLALAVDKSSRSGDSSENTSTALPDASDLRRSNRRIQPTARLLEGLQSSLVISKIPSFPHDKGNKAQTRGTSSRGNSHD